jgi:pimeloyl-ACP methyl ester carboxylesterase
MTTDHVVRLRDGRSLSYAQYGDPAGFPILSAHGGLACRLDVGPAASVAAQSGVRLISPDRPGVGRSDPRDDLLLDPKWPAELARRIPNATLHLRPGGHFLAHLYYRDIFDGLRRE